MNIPFVLHKNAEPIIRNLEQESIDTYFFIKTQFSETIDVKENFLFHFVFRSFYRLDNAGLTKEFKNEYFNTMQDIRGLPGFDFKNVCTKLYNFKNLKGQQTLQFSFVTKMANIINENFPIYDSEVASMFGFRRPYNYKEYDQRLKEYCDFYINLTESYKEFLLIDNVLEVIDMFDNKFSRTENISKIKKLDFLMWSAGKLKNKNLLVSA